MSLLLIGIMLGAALAALGILLLAIMIGIHRQERAASLGHRPASLSAALARRILGLHAPDPYDPATHHTENTRPKETRR
jgi:hypothetical protein